MTKIIIVGTCSSGAIFNSDRSRRYALWRVWTADSSAVTVPRRARSPRKVTAALEAICPARLLINFGTNPSDADEDDPDPTTRRVVKLGKRERCDGVLLVNFASIVSSVQGPLLSRPDPCDALNEHTLSTALSLFQRDGVECLHVAAWGKVPGTLALSRSHVLDTAARHSTGFLCLKTNLDGSPRHLSARGTHRLRDDAPLVPWERQEMPRATKRPPPRRRRPPGAPESPPEAAESPATREDPEPEAQEPEPADALLGAHRDFSEHDRNAAIAAYARETAAMVRSLKDTCPSDEDYNQLTAREFRAAWLIVCQVFDITTMKPTGGPTYDYRLWRDAVAKAMGWLSGRLGSSSCSWVRDRQREALGQATLFPEMRKGKHRS